jgi:dTMP kinase
MSFIVIEGIDCAGKSTQARLLHELFGKCGLEAMLCSFPDYGSPTGKFIKDHLHGEVYTAAVTKYGVPIGHSLYDTLVFQCAQTCDKYARAGAIMAALSRGQVVVSDRWWQSGLVYGADDGLDPVWFRDVYACLPQADLNLLLDVSPGNVTARRADPGDRYERDLAKQRRLRQLYLDLWHDSSHGYGEWKILSGEVPLEEVHDLVVGVVKDYFSRFYSKSGGSSIADQTLKTLLAETH